MNTKKVKPIVQGAMIAGIYGVLAIVNLYTGSLFDVLFSYAMVLPMTWYSLEYSFKYSLSLLIASGVILFFVGELFFLFFSVPTLLMGIFYGYTLKKSISSRITNIGLLLISAVKNYFIFFVFGSMLGISVFEEGLEMYEMCIAIIPRLRNILSVNASFVIIWILIFVSEAYIVEIYSNWFLKRTLKKK